MAYDEIIMQEAHRAIACEYQPDDIEDLRQEGRIAVAVKLGQEGGDIDLRLCRKIARDKMRDWLRREARHRHQAPLPTSQ